MKIKIGEEKVNLIESLDLNLGKELTKYQQKFNVTKELDKIFGKNVYRLYYDLKTGKQIFPTNKSNKTNLKLDVEYSDELRGGIENVLQNNEYELVDFDKNIAKNHRTGQSIKITKVLDKVDRGYLKNYNTYLDSISKGLEDNENVVVIVSRHAYDIAGMSTDREWSSCEDLQGITKLNQLDNFADEDEGYGDGGGVRAGMMIRDGSFIFYTVRYGDWNIKNPLSRFASGVYCLNDLGADFGRTVDGFKPFLKKWLHEYAKKYQANYKNDESLIQTGDMYDVYYFFYHNHHKKIYNTDADFYRELLKYNRQDVFTKIFDEDYNNDSAEILRYQWYRTEELIGTFGFNVLNQIGEDAKAGILRLYDVIYKSGLRIVKSYNNRFNIYKFYDEQFKLKELSYSFIPNIIGNVIMKDMFQESNKTLKKIYPPHIVDKTNNEMEVFGRVYFKDIEAEYKNYLLSKEPEPVNENKNKMKKIIRIKQSELNQLLESRMNETFGSFTNDDKSGEIEIEKRSARPAEIKKYTQQGIDVKLVDEEIGEEQPVSLKHKFEGKNLNIFSTRDKVTIKEVLKYIDGIEDQSLVETSFDNDKVTLFVKKPSSGRYSELGSFTQDALRKFRELESGESGADDILNESLSLDKRKG